MGGGGREWRGWAVWWRESINVNRGSCLYLSMITQLRRRGEEARGRYNLLLCRGDGGIREGNGSGWKAVCFRKRLVERKGVRIVEI